MENRSEVVINTEIEVGSGNCFSLYKFPATLKTLVYSAYIPIILLTLCLATSTINTLIHTALLFECLAFLLLVCCICVSSRLIVAALIFFIERHFVMKSSKALYFLFALRTSVEYFFLASLLLLSWFFFIDPDVSVFVFLFVTSTLATFVIATVLWMSKIVILKGLDCCYREQNYFCNMQHLISHEYVLQTLLGFFRGSNESNTGTLRAHLRWIKVAFSNMQLLVCARLHTICHALENHKFEDEQEVENIISMVFKNLTNNEPRDIQETDLLMVMRREDIQNVLQLFERGAETKQISEASLKQWMIKVCNERNLVVHLLNKTSNVIEQLDIIMLVNFSFLVIVSWCLLMGFGTTKFLVYVTSHLLLLVFVLGDYCKMVCQGIMLAIVMHPFDIGDHCIIDDEQLVVEDIGLINTVFLKDNNEKLIYLNSVLLTKSISNLNRSSKLKDTLEILVSSTTSPETIAALKLKIDELLGSEPESWHAEHCFDLKGTDSVTRKYDLQITHTSNFQNYKERNHRRSKLVIKLIKLLEEYNIENFTIQ